jgi:riboflavin synthase
MFTGIVEELGTVESLEGGNAQQLASLRIACQAVIDGTKIGDSISVNGCCLTVTALSDTGFTVDVMGETLARTSVGRAQPGEQVNLERAMPADGRLGGHLVQGHVDSTCTVTQVMDHGDWTVMRFALPKDLAPYIVEKGSITVDGTSLTVMGVDDEEFWVGLIPHTLAATVLGRRQPGQVVNLEADIVAKYVERMLSAGVDTPYSAVRADKD